MVIETNKTAMIYATYSKNETTSLLLSKFYKKTREIYKDNIIFIVDNNSLNKSYMNYISDFNIKNNCKNTFIVSNDDNTFKYEYGAYKIGLENVKAPHYILLQSSTILVKKIDEAPNNISAFICAIESDDCIDNEEAKLARKLYKSKWKIPTFVYGSNLICDKYFAKKFYDEILTKIPITNKIESCASERITGEFLQNYCNSIYAIESFVYKNRIYCGNILISYNFKTYLNANKIKNFHEINIEKKDEECSRFVDFIANNMYVKFFIKINLDCQ